MFAGNSEKWRSHGTGLNTPTLRFLAKAMLYGSKRLWKSFFLGLIVFSTLWFYYILKQNYTDVAREDYEQPLVETNLHRNNDLGNVERISNLDEPNVNVQNIDENRWEISKNENINKKPLMKTHRDVQNQNGLAKKSQLKNRITMKDKSKINANVNVRKSIAVKEDSV